MAQPTHNNPNKAITLKLPNDEMLHFVPIPAGQFVFQPDEQEVEKTYQIPAFWMLHTPLTQGQYRALMPQAENPSTHTGRSLPVTNVSWLDIHAQDGVLTQMNTLLAKQYGNLTCRLPHEVEWEYVASYEAAQTPHYTYAGSNTAMPVAWFDQNSYNQPMPVGAKPANALGLHDLSGNVREWCLNKWEQPHYPLTTPPSPTSDTTMAVRGGTVWSHRGSVRARLRNGCHAGFRGLNLGLRLCVFSQLPKQGG